MCSCANASLCNNYNYDKLEGDMIQMLYNSMHFENNRDAAVHVLNSDYFSFNKTFTQVYDQFRT